MTGNGKRAFTLGAVLSVMTGKRLCEMDQIYEILNYLTGTSLYDVQLPRAAKACRPYVIQQVPALAGVDASEVNPENVRAWLADAEAQYGDLILLEPIPLFGFQRKDIVDELVETVGEDKVSIWIPGFP